MMPVHHHSDTPRQAIAGVNGPVFVLGPASDTGVRPVLFIDAKRLPRYTREKRLKDGSIAYYWAVPTWAAGSSGDRQRPSWRPLAALADLTPAPVA